MEKIKYFLIMVMVMLLLTGCTPKMLAILLAGDGEEQKQGIEKQACMLEDVSSNFSIAYKENVIAYITRSTDAVEFYNKETQEEMVAKLPESYESLQITAGDKYFYVYCSDEDDQGYLRIYNTKAELMKEFELPFQKVLASEGIIFGYYDIQELPSSHAWGWNNSNSNVEATHYIGEKEFLDTCSSDISQWKKIEGETQVAISKKMLYRCPMDYYHTVEYYSTEKKLDVLEQVSYLRYCNGRIASDENDKFVKGRLEQIYNMMHEKEKNFVMYSFQKDNKIYGVCNVYRDSGGMLNLLTEEIEYSFTFSYDENQDTLYKIKEYDKLELVYTDGEHLLTHKLDGVYYQDLQTLEEKKVYDYDGSLNIIVVDGCVNFKEVVIHYADTTPDVQVVKKVW
nr:hypothetical protein [Eubacterium sp.]